MRNLEINHQRGLAKALEKLKDSEVHPRNKQIISGFINARMHAKAGTRYSYLRMLFHSAKFFKKPYDELTRAEFNEFLPTLEGLYSPRSYNDRIKTHRMLYNWLEKPEVVKDAQKKRNIKPVHQAPDLLTFEEFKKLLDTCYNLRDRCLIHLFWETGARVSEILSIQLKDIKEEEFGFTITIRESKTEPRPAIIVEAKDDLDAWLQQHPYKNMPDAPLFVSVKYRTKIERMEYTTVRNLLDDLSLRSGIKKHVHAHLFRKSRATYLITKRKWSTPLVEKALGWSEGSKILKEYVRLSIDDVKDRALEDAGMKPVEDNNHKTWKCLFCSHQNSPTRDRCYICKKSKKTAEELYNKQVELQDVMLQVQSLQREITAISGGKK